MLPEENVSRTDKPESSPIFQNPTHKPLLYMCMKNAYNDTQPQTHAIERCSAPDARHKSVLGSRWMLQNGAQLQTHAIKQHSAPDTHHGTALNSKRMPKWQYISLGQHAEAILWDGVA